jgi:hypothetical protein
MNGAWQELPHGAENSASVAPASSGRAEGDLYTSLISLTDAAVYNWMRELALRQRCWHGHCSRTTRGATA